LPFKRKKKVFTGIDKDKGVAGKERKKAASNFTLVKQKTPKWEKKPRGKFQKITINLSVNLEVRITIQLGARAAGNGKGKLVPSDVGGPVGNGRQRTVKKTPRSKKTLSTKLPAKAEEKKKTVKGVFASVGRRQRERQKKWGKFKKKESETGGRKYRGLNTTNACQNEGGNVVSSRAKTLIN